MRDEDLMMKHSKSLEESDDPSGSVDDILEDPAPGLDEAFDIIKRHARILERPVGAKDFEGGAVAMLRKAAKADPKLSVTVVKRGLVTPEFGDELAGSQGTTKSAMRDGGAAAKPEGDGGGPKREVKSGFVKGRGGWVYESTDDGFVITEAPEDYQDKIGLVVKKGMRGYDDIAREVAKLSSE